ncbi:MAG TPA: hypothetical protein VK524_21585 [Polyangiaceae bacterium]|nr:hypothetical protein [Polyangiaceae bacterium]
MLRVTVSVLALLLTQCDEKPKDALAPAASALSKPVAPREAQVFVIDSGTSNTTFSMDSELEKISGRAPGALRGELFVNLHDLTKSSGLVQLDLDQLGIYQRKRDDTSGEFGTETKNDKQNADMRTWFEISQDTPADVRQGNRWAEFKLTELASPSLRDVSAAQAEHKLTAQVKGDFRLHGRVKPRSARLEIRVVYAAERPQALHVRTLEPLLVGLEEHDVRPRSAFGKLADKTLDALGAKVAKVAQVSLEFTARPKSAAP